MDEINELRGLKPKERLKRLKELEDKKKEEIEQTEKLIVEAESDIKKEALLEEVPVPEVEEKDISEMFEPENLEETVEQGEEIEGTPYQPARAAFKPNSPVSTPFMKIASTTLVEIVWQRIPFFVPFIE